MTWMQPVCWPCWELRRPGPAPALRLYERALCCYCGTPTSSGLRVYVDVSLVPYPLETAGGAA